MPLRDVEPEKLTVISGTGKDGNPEPVKSLDIATGEIVSLVGVTGSGKSRLLTDIEWLSVGDSPTKRRVLINGKTRAEMGVDPADIVARLSQSMMYHLDMNVKEFLGIYAESRNIQSPGEKAAEVFDWANRMSGEQFAMNTPLCELSGGQARALMISETALLSNCRIVLVDEIENAGIDRQRALDLLSGAGMITVLATHDPILSLKSHRRLILSNGAMTKLVETSDIDKKVLADLEETEKRADEYRSRIRTGADLI
jgi:ABC-type lipoprotein export system ATPase subunit